MKDRLKFTDQTKKKLYKELSDEMKKTTTPAEFELKQKDNKLKKELAFV